MLTLQGPRYRYCDGINRRSFLSIGALAMGGIGLTDFHRAEAATGKGLGHKAVIMVYLPGGPPHIDLVDPKPDAPKEIRSPFGIIDTNVSGIRVGEMLPNLAKMMDKLTIVRSLYGSRDEHASDCCYSGYPIAENRDGSHPSLGAVLSRVYGPVNREAPPFVELIPKTSHAPYSNPGRPGFLGARHSSVRPYAEGMNDYTLKGITLDRLQDRRRLLDSMDAHRRGLELSGVLDGADALTSRAFEMLMSDRLVKALDLKDEPEPLRERYGKGSNAAITDAGPDWNEQFLMARRLVETGVRCVTIGFGGWDYHSYWNPKPDEQGRRLDQAVSALVSDLHDRGLDKDVSVVVWGDFGRTPRFNKDGGRDHWPAAGFCILAGGGMRSGQVIGSTNAFGEMPDERPIHYRDVFATLYHNVGLNLETTPIYDSQNRPHFLLADHKPIRELV